MAIKKCKECSKPISSKATACPNCGAPLKNKTSCLGCLLGVVFIFVFLGVIGGFGGDSVSKTSRGESDSNLSDSINTAPSKLPKSKWRYVHGDDPMSKGRIHQASIESENTVNFDFPYSGSQRGKLYLRTHPKYGKDLYLSIERGQFLANSYDNSKALVRFDDSKPITYRITDSDDHRTTTIFFKDYHGFVKRMLRSQRVRISVPIYQEGHIIFEFDVKGFDTDAYLEKPAKD